ncbi:unnamed protein product [Symbiodinium natans]|uniref:Uncharacterized protein n=1 Tax=Symbiodinium natans TaxID=878477 RepID=A0A812PMW1_9DINO|nr:unnamed protein product [Symbiodinium natans]
MAASSDRWVEKLLAFNRFDDEFRKAVRLSILSNLILVNSLECSSEQDFSAKILQLLTVDSSEAHDIVIERLNMLEHFWVLSKAAETLVDRSLGFQLGFGQVDRREPPVQVARDKRSLVLGNLLAPPPKLPRSATKALNQDDQELGEKQRWAQRLQDIQKRAGEWAGISEAIELPSVLSPGEKARLRNLVFTSGAPTTMAGHIRRFEKFESWAAFAAIPFYPMTEEKFLKYLLDLDAKECGPSVIPSLRTALKWVAFRIDIELPDVDSARILSLEKQVFDKRGKPLKEAPPYPLEVVVAMEKFVTDEKQPVPPRLFIWWVVCMIMASLRFDDAVHVRPSELEIHEEGIFGVSWQTKTERKRRGTKFLVPRVSFSGVEWLQIGWDLFHSCFKDNLDRDFWLPELYSADRFAAHPPTYARSLQWLHHLVWRVANENGVSAVVLAEILLLTWHSARVTLLDQAVQQGKQPDAIGLQANWKNPGPLVLKYARARTSVPANMIKEIVQEYRQACVPRCIREDDLVDDGIEVEPSIVGFFMKTPKKGSSYEYKIHVCAADDLNAIACGRTTAADCEHIGDLLPDVTLLCKHCARERPDVARAHNFQF